ncbi:hypothetical protein LIER_28216 [Lithospermum erythrorhizon]|uniref:Uncharacterized protein n=1 Tax=Lithospermum erythrorhizon TaxID=34254 RepID=A0AAV3RG21_LITER
MDEAPYRNVFTLQVPEEITKKGKPHEDVWSVPFDENDPAKVFKIDKRATAVNKIKYKGKVASYFNKKVRSIEFWVGDLVLRERQTYHHGKLGKGKHLCCRRAGAAVLSDFVLHYLDEIPSLNALAEEYRRWFPAGWLDNTMPLPLSLLFFLPLEGRSYNSNDGSYSTPQVSSSLAALPGSGSSVPLQATLVATRAPSAPQSKAVIIRRPKATEQANAPPPGLRSIFFGALENGMRLPFYSYVGDMLSVAGICPTQLM